MINYAMLKTLMDGVPETARTVSKKLQTFPLPDPQPSSSRFQDLDIVYLPQELLNLGQSETLARFTGFSEDDIPRIAAKAQEGIHILRTVIFDTLENQNPRRAYFRELMRAHTFIFVNKANPNATIDFELYPRSDFMTVPISSESSPEELAMAILNVVEKELSSLQLLEPK